LRATRIAVAGAGLIGAAHMRVAAASPTCALSAVVDPAPAASRAATEAGVPLYGSLEELLERDRPDGVVLATPNRLHFQHALTCIEAGLPVLIEKPMATSVAEGEKLLNLVSERNATVLVGHHRAHSPLMARAKEIVDSGALGRLVAVQGSAMFYKPDEYFREGPWRSEPGGGPILLNMIHEVHSLRMLCGEVADVRAIASASVRGFPVEDTVAIALRFDSGALGTFMLSDTAACARSWEQTSGENRAYPSYDDEDCYVISGTNGTLSVPTMRMKTYARPEDRSWWRPFRAGAVAVERADPLMRQMEHFGAVVRGEAAPLVTARDGLTNLRVTEAIASAAARC
jgi:predicted dehydrogenase